MTTTLVIVLVDRPARAQPDHTALAAYAQGGIRRQLLKLRLEPVQPVRPQRLRRQADQMVELAIVVRADRREHAIGQRAHRLAGFSGDSAEIVPCGSDDASDRAVAVVAPFVDRGRYRQHAPKKVECLVGARRRDMGGDRLTLRLEVTGEVLYLAPVDERARFGDGDEPLADLARDVTAAAAREFEPQPALGRRVTGGYVEQQLRQALGSKRGEVLRIQCRPGRHALSSRSGLDPSSGATSRKPAKAVWGRWVRKDAGQLPCVVQPTRRNSPTSPLGLGEPGAGVGEW